MARLGGYHRECVRDCSWHPHLPMLATCSFDGSCALWEPCVPGEEEAAGDEAAAAGGGKPGRSARALPRPHGDQFAW